MMYFVHLIAVAFCSTITLVEGNFGIDDNVNRIVHGDPAAYGQFPWQVAMHFTNPSRTTFCGASLISDQWIITAAHCSQGALNYTLKVGGLILYGEESGRVEVSSSTHFIHPLYNGLNHFDVALVKLDRPVEFNDRIQSVKLPKRGDVTRDDEQVTVSGWGRTTDASPDVSNILNFVTIRSITNEECAKTYGNGIVVDSILCTVGNPGHGTCNGDSGGPLVIYKNGEPTQVGIVSYGHIDGCETEFPTGFIRTESILGWISEITGLDV